MGVRRWDIDFVSLLYTRVTINHNGALSPAKRRMSNCHQLIADRLLWMDVYLQNFPSEATAPYTRMKGVNPVERFGVVRKPQSTAGSSSIQAPGARMTQFLFSRINKFDSVLCKICFALHFVSPQQILLRWKGNRESRGRLREYDIFRIIKSYHLTFIP